MKIWTILLAGVNTGLVGRYGETFPTSPEHYRRVDVVEADDVLALLQKTRDEYNETVQAMKALKAQIHDLKVALQRDMY